ncbi:hypothetical protein PVK06_040441 [Gossypium arboreum]|uniref:Putative plant transposon protein domain-containing protein n=1 Tax=Gossypium arboreum TaxID=29729 RepID=A0ABR0N665_GOSAR|nr:hypothetical protein PVK06_040441 [Gossypium arboreum]
MPNRRPHVQLHRMPIALVSGRAKRSSVCACCSCPATIQAESCSRLPSAHAYCSRPQRTSTQRLSAHARPTAEGSLLNMPRKRTCASSQIDETQNKFLCEEAKRSSADEELVREFYANITSSEITEVLVCGIKGSTWTVSKQGIHTCRREYLTPLAKVWFYFIRFSLMPSSHGTTISSERMVLLYTVLTGKTIDVGKIILREIQNCAVKRSGPAHLPFTITILCLKAEILANVRKTGYSQGTIIDWGLYRVTGDSILQQ